MKPIPFAKVSCDGHELDYVREVLESGWLTTAGKAQQLEQNFAAAVGARFACAVNSCTAALHLALEALQVGPGDKVFVPTMTFTASAEVIRYLGADPVFLDVEYASNLVTPSILEEAIVRHPEVKTLVLVHFGGQAADMTSGVPDGLRNICRDHGIRIVEDAAHAFPAKHDGRFVGTFGDATCFSFYANKTMTTAEGGMLVTDDENIAERARLMRLHGIDRAIWDRFSGNKPAWEYDVVAPGYKYNMPDVNAAIGLAQLERADRMRDERQRCAEYYFEQLSKVEGLDLPKISGKWEDHAWHLFVIFLNDNAGIDRNELIEQLGEDGIATSVHYKPLHRMTYYKERYQLDATDFPGAERSWSGCVSIPLYPSLREEELNYICSSMTRHVAHADAGSFPVLSR